MDTYKNFKIIYEKNWSEKKVVVKIFRADQHPDSDIPIVEFECKLGLLERVPSGGAKAAIDFLTDEKDSDFVAILVSINEAEEKLALIKEKLQSLRINLLNKKYRVADVEDEHEKRLYKLVKGVVQASMDITTMPALVEVEKHIDWVNQSHFDNDEKIEANPIPKA